MAKKRYTLELTKAQLAIIGNSLEIAELDLTGGYGYESGMNAHCWKKQKRHILTERINIAISEAIKKGLKTITAKALAN